jgi:hypothetical protein
LAASSDAELNEFQSFLAKKYDVTSNDNGTFLVILRTKLPDGSSIFTKPFIIFTQYLPNGPFISPLPTTPMSVEYIKSFNEHFP